MKLKKGPLQQLLLHLPMEPPHLLPHRLLHLLKPLLLHLLPQLLLHLQMHLLLHLQMRLLLTELRLQHLMLHQRLLMQLHPQQKKHPLPQRQPQRLPSPLLRRHLLLLQLTLRPLKNLHHHQLTSPWKVAVRFIFYRTVNFRFFCLFKFDLIFSFTKVKVYLELVTVSSQSN